MCTNGRHAIHLRARSMKKHEQAWIVVVFKKKVQQGSPVLVSKVIFWLWMHWHAATFSSHLSLLNLTCTRLCHPCKPCSLASPTAPTPACLLPFVNNVVKIILMILRMQGIWIKLSVSGHKKTKGCTQSHLQLDCQRLHPLVLMATHKCV